MKKILLMLILPGFVFHMPLRAQTWINIPAYPNDFVQGLKANSGGLAVGGKFTQIGSTSYKMMGYLTASSPGNYTWTYQIQHDFNSSASFSGFAGTYVQAIEDFDSRFHIGGNFFYPFYTNAVNIGYLTYNSSNFDYDFDIYYGFANQPVYAMKAYNSKLYFGGDFQNFIGVSYVGYINSNDYPSPLPYSMGAGLSGPPRCFEVYNSALYAGGGFSTSGTTTVNRIAKWDGTSWSALGGGMDGPVYSLAVYNGELYAGGHFTMAGTTPVNNIAKWNGTVWSAVSNGLTGGSYPIVYTLKVYNGRLYAGGEFTTSGSTTVTNLAKWNGTSWAALGSGTNGRVRAFEIYDGNLFIGGEFTTANSATHNYLIAYYEPPVGINELSESQINLNIFPNPTSDISSVSGGSILKTPGTRVEVFTTGGKKMLSYIVADTDKDIRIDFREFPAGIYFVKVTGKDHSSGIEKVIVARTK